MTAKTETTAPVVCTLSEADLARRREELRQGLLEHVRAVDDLADGYALHFTADDERRQELRAFIDFEESCCSFLSFAIVEDDTHTTPGVRLDLRGPDGTREFLEPWLHEARSKQRRLAADPGGKDTVHNAGKGSPRNRRALGVGMASAASLFALICCATPMLAVALGALGFGALTADVAGAIDLAAPAVLLISVGLLVHDRRRRNAKSASAQSACGSGCGATSPR